MNPAYSPHQWSIHWDCVHEDTPSGYCSEDGHIGLGATFFGMFVHLIVLCSLLNPSLSFSRLIPLLLPGKLSLPEHTQVLAVPVGCLWSFRGAVCLQPLIHSVSQRRRRPQWQIPACTGSLFSIPAFSFSHSHLVSLHRLVCLTPPVSRESTEPCFHYCQRGYTHEVWIKAASFCVCLIVGAVVDSFYFLFIY